MTAAGVPRRQGGDWTPADTRRLLAVTLAALVLFVYGLGAGTLWDQDEAKYVEVSREILATGDLFTLRIDGVPWFVHPPLFMWLQALLGKVFGFTEFTVRFWSAVSGAGIVAATFLLGRLLYGPRVALLAGAITATSLQVLIQARLAVFDPTLVLFMLLALYMYLVAYTTGSRRDHLWAWVWAGLATITKGPIGLLLPAMVIVGLWVVRRDWWRWREIPLLGPVIYAVVGLSWYVIETIRHGEAFLRSAVGYYLFNRFFGVVEEQSGPWWFYAPVLILGAFPWTAFIPAAVAWLLRRGRDLGSQVVLLWCGITVVFYSLAGTKLANYVLPVYPMLAIGIAGLWTDFLDGVPEAARLRGWAGALLPVISVVVIVTAAVIGLRGSPEQVAALRAPLVTYAGLLAGGPLIALGFLVTRRPARALAALLLTMVISVPVMAHQTLPAIERFRPIPRIARALAAEMRPGDVLAAVRMTLNSSLRYYSGQRITWVEQPAELTQVLCGQGRVFLVVPVREDDAWAHPLLPAGVRLQGQDGGYRIYVKDAVVSCSGARPTP